MDALARKLDELWHRVEQALILLSVAFMTVLVGSDVIQRTFSRPVGKTEAILAWLLESVSGPLSAETRAAAEGWAGKGLFLLLAAGFLVGATHAARLAGAARKGQLAPSLTGSTVRGVAVFLLCGAAVEALLWTFPSSVPGAQKFALGFMLWSGMLGASVATRERSHIILDAISKKVGASARRTHALASGLAAGAFCAFVSLLGWMQLAGEVRDWAAGDGVGLYESLPVPTWIATLAIPVSFASMALRFWGYAIRDFRFGPPSGGEGSHGVDLEKLEKESIPVSPSENAA